MARAELWEMGSEALEFQVQVLKAIAHPVRMRLVARLAHGDANVTTLCDALELPQAIVSQQLRVLRMSHIVGPSRVEGFVVYRLLEPDLKKVLECVARCAMPQLVRGRRRTGGAK